MPGPWRTMQLRRTWPRRSGNAGSAPPLKEAPSTFTKAPGALKRLAAMARCSGGEGLRTCAVAHAPRSFPVSPLMALHIRDLRHSDSAGRSTLRERAPCRRAPCTGGRRPRPDRPARHKALGCNQAHARRRNRHVVGHRRGPISGLAVRYPGAHRRGLPLAHIPRRGPDRTSVPSGGRGSALRTDGDAVQGGPGHGPSEAARARQKHRLIPAPVWRPSPL